MGLNALFSRNHKEPQAQSEHLLETRDNQTSPSKPSIKVPASTLAIPSTTMAQLPPVPHPIGIFEPWIAKGPETLVLKEKVMSLTGDSFDIKTINGQPIFKIKGRKMSISGRKTVTDMKENHLFDIVKELMHIHSTYAAESPSGQKILEVKNSFKREYIRELV